MCLSRIHPSLIENRTYIGVAKVRELSGMQGLLPNTSRSMSDLSVFFVIKKGKRILYVQESNQNVTYFIKAVSIETLFSKKFCVED